MVSASESNVIEPAASVPSRAAGIYRYHLVTRYVRVALLLGVMPLFVGVPEPAHYHGIAVVGVGRSKAASDSVRYLAAFRRRPRGRVTYADEARQPWQRAIDTVF